jgi:hypothetical protein
MKIYTDTKLRFHIRTFRPGTPIVSRFGGYIGHVISYTATRLSVESAVVTGEKFHYQLLVSWMQVDDETPITSVVDFEDVSTL